MPRIALKPLEFDPFSPIRGFFCYEVADFGKIKTTHLHRRAELKVKCQKYHRKVNDYFPNKQIEMKFTKEKGDGISPPPQMYLLRPMELYELEQRQFFSKFVYAALYLRELLVGNVGVAFLVLAHEGAVDADVVGKRCDVEHRVVFKQRCEVELENNFFFKFRWYLIAIIPIRLQHLFFRVEKVLFCLGHGVACADERHFVASRIVGYISAIFLLFNADVHSCFSFQVLVVYGEKRWQGWRIANADKDRLFAQLLKELRLEATPYFLRAVSFDNQLVSSGRMAVHVMPLAVSHELIAALLRYLYKFTPFHA